MHRLFIKLDPYVIFIRHLSNFETTSISSNFIHDDLWRMYFKFGNAINSSTSSTVFFTTVLRNGNDRLESAGSNLFRPVGRKRETGVISLTRRRRFIVWPPVTKTKRFSHTRAHTHMGWTISGERAWIPRATRRTVTGRLRKLCAAVPRPLHATPWSRNRIEERVSGLWRNRAKSSRL